MSTCFHFLSSGFYCINGERLPGLGFVQVSRNGLFTSKEFFVVNLDGWHLARQVRLFGSSLLNFGKFLLGFLVETGNNSLREISSSLWFLV